jgi:CheY-like chemotaxis protein
MIHALVIDDVRLTADSLCQMLQLLESSSPGLRRAGLLALNEAVPDVVFLDLNMPGLSGFKCWLTCAVTTL